MDSDPFQVTLQREEDVPSSRFLIFVQRNGFSESFPRRIGYRVTEDGGGCE
jgi:hypothetical protein